MSFLDNHQEFPTDPPRTWPSRYNAMLEALDKATTVLQVVTAVSTALDETTSTSLQDSSLAASITPKRADSKLIVAVSGEVHARQDSGTLIQRVSEVAIRNETDATMLAVQRRGRDLASGSSDPATHYGSIGLDGEYAVDSATERTFRLQHRAVNSGVESRIIGVRDGGVRMTIMEVAQ